MKHLFMRMIHRIVIFLLGMKDKDVIEFQKGYAEFLKEEKIIENREEKINKLLDEKIDRGI